MRGGSAASCCARWPSSDQPAGCRGTGFRSTRGPYAVSCRKDSGSAPPSRTYIPRAPGGSCSISSTAFHELTRDDSPSLGRERAVELQCLTDPVQQRLFGLERRSVDVHIALVCRTF